MRYQRMPAWVREAAAAGGSEAGAQPWRRVRPTPPAQCECECATTRVWVGRRPHGRRRAAGYGEWGGGAPAGAWNRSCRQPARVEMWSTAVGEGRDSSGGGACPSLGRRVGCGYLRTERGEVAAGRELRPRAARHRGRSTQSASSAATKLPREAARAAWAGCGSRPLAGVDGDLAVSTTELRSQTRRARPTRGGDRWRPVA
jgi:hypothetical protein